MYYPLFFGDEPGDEPPTGGAPDEPGKLLLAFDQELFMRHQCYNRECLRAYAHANCLERGKRLYKIVQALPAPLAGASVQVTVTHVLDTEVY